MHFPKFTYFLLFKAHHIFYSRISEKRRSTQLLHQLQEQLGGATDDFTFSKIINSYSIYIPMICDSFTQLNKRNCNKKEKERIFYYFICSSLFDNFCDRKELDEKALYNIFYHPEQFTPQNFDQKLFLFAHQFLNEEVQNKAAYHRSAQDLFAAQLASDKQFDPNITQEELKEITSKKGGYAVLLCHFYLDQPASAQEQQCWYQLGGMIQLTNDLYDIYKDLQDGSITLATRTRQVATIDAYFHQQVREFKQTITVLPYSQAQKRSFLHAMMLIGAFGATAIQQLKALQGTRQYLPDWDTIERKKLIVDMEKPSTLLRYLKNCYAISK